MLNIKEEDLNLDGDSPVEKISTPKPSCEICKQNEFKYTCPRCLVKTCSVKCVKNHKEKLNCSGIKDKFLKCRNIKEIDENNFYKDVSFINESINGVNVANKKIYHLSHNDENVTEKKHKNLKRLAKKFRNVNFICCPNILQRFKENKSYCDAPNKKFYWSVKFIFVISDETKYEHLFTNVFDDIDFTLNTMLDHLKDNIKDVDAKLLPYVSYPDWEKKIKIFYRIDQNTNFFTKKKCSKIGNYYYEECDWNLTLKELIDGKDVYEYPEFYIFNLYKV